jgi:hypothetical protein
VRLEGLGQLIHPMISLGIEPATFRLVVRNMRIPPAVLACDEKLDFFFGTSF